ncbi:MAG: helix-turn-helix domain-containing protein [Flavobacteriales bacterium]
MKKVENDENTNNGIDEEIRNDYQFIRMFNSVCLRDDLKIEDKYIICYVISYQLQGKQFYATNSYLGRICGCSETKISRIIKRLTSHFNVVRKSTDGKSNNRRFISMKNLKDWVPYEITKDIKVDVAKFKTIPEFMRWANTVFNTNDEIFNFSSYNKQVEKHLESIDKAA